MSDDEFRSLVQFHRDPEEFIVVPTCRSIAQRLGLDEKLVIEIHKRGGGGQITPQPVDGLLESEYQALTGPDSEHHPEDRFQKRIIDFHDYISKQAMQTKNAVDRRLALLVRSVQRVDRLRLVRVLRGFSRITREPEGMVPVDITKELKWLPAVEYYGEGVFIEFDALRLLRWEQRVEQMGEKHELDMRRYSGLMHRFQAMNSGLRSSFPEGDKFRLSLRMIALHTLAHLLIHQMQYHSGYSASSIRERLYLDMTPRQDPMSGMLLFTSAGDVEGSMGGLARLSSPKQLEELIKEALFFAEECSADPVCYESEGQGIDGCNLAACHACTLLPETSCAYRNQFLDRRLLIDPAYGLFTIFGEI